MLQNNWWEESDQYQYLGNFPPTPPLTQQQSIIIDNKLGWMLGKGRGRWAVAQILLLSRGIYMSDRYIVSQIFT